MVTAIGLPLLIVNGKFRSLSSMSVEELETFIPFLAQCSVNRAGAQLVNGVPEWWSSTIQYKFPLKKPNGLSHVGYKRHLSSIVCRCYWYHDAQFILPFCSEIVNSPESIFLRSNEDNTTSIYYVRNTLHVMTFNNENKDYDMKTKKEKPCRRRLLSALPKKPSTIVDVYLCDDCDAEFSSYSEMANHEKNCYKSTLGTVVNESNSGRIETNFEEIEILEHIKPATESKWNKISYLSYLNLSPVNNNEKTMNTKTILKENHCKSWDFSSYKNRKVEFSSLFGRKMLERKAKQDLKHKIHRSLMFTEAHCSTSVRSNRELREPVEFKTALKKYNDRSWAHQYSFSKRQRRSRYLILRTGLDKRSRQLLKQCKKLRIILNRVKVNS